MTQKLLGGSQNFEIGSRDQGHAHLGVVLFSVRRRGPSSVSVPNLKQIALFVQKLLGGPKFRPTIDPLPGARDSKNVISWRWSYLQTQFGEDRCTQFRVIVVTDPQTHKHRHKHMPPSRHRQDRQYTAPLSLACSVNILKCTHAFYNN